MKAALELFARHCTKWKWSASAAAVKDLPEALVQRVHVIEYEPDPAHKRGMMALRIYLTDGGYIETLSLSPSDANMTLLIRAARITLEKRAPEVEYVYPVLPDGGGAVPVEKSNA